MRTSIRVFIAATTGALALALAACGAKTSDLVTVDRATVTSGRLVQHVEFSGVLAPSRTSSVSSRLSGQARTVTVDIGAKVNAGQVLIEIDTRELAAQLVVADAAVQLVRDQATQGKLGIDTAKDNLDLARKSYDRAAALITTQSITQGQLDDAQTKLRVSQTAFENAAQQYQLLSSSSLAQAQAQENLIRVQISNGVIVSPIGGVVTNRNVNPGEVASMNTPLMTIADTSMLKLQGNVAQAIATLLAPGTRVKVQVDGMRDGDYDGVITQVGPVAASTGQFFPVIVSLKNDGRLMAGMTALASFDLQGPPALLVPRAVITTANGTAYAFVLSQGKVVRRTVSLGPVSATTVEVLRGLAAGEQVAASNVDTLQDGMVVRTEEQR